MEARTVPREAVSGGSAGLMGPRLLRGARDERLVALVRQGERAAFEAIYDRYHRPILSFCRHMLADQEEAADAVQHTFMAAYTSITTSTKPLLLRAWLFTIARNRCYSVLRSRREQPAGELVEPATEGLAAEVQRREDLRELLVDMRDLPDDQRAALVLAELGALEHGEIATTLGVPAPKVKALVFQARESLIASRSARDTDCIEIRRELANARGAALRRANLRRHLRQCRGCREYRQAVQHQRRSLAAILPVAPVLGLKDSIFGALFGGGTSTGIVTGSGLLASSAFKGLVLKGLVSGFLALTATAGTIALVHAVGQSGPSNALADTAPPGSGAFARDPLRAGAFPLGLGAARRHARAVGYRGRGGRAAGGRGIHAAAAALAIHASRKQGAAVDRAHHQSGPAAPAVTSGAQQHAAAPRRHDGGGSTGSQSQTTGGPGHGRGHAYGHDPGHDPGLHLGWGKGVGGGRTHPHGHG
jgi:RNA polymerase sigma factor (sigma-70 family)